MTVPWRYLFGFIGLLVAVAGALAAIWMLSPPPPGLDMSLSKSSAKGLFQLAIEPEAGPVKQGALQSWIVTVKTPAGAPVDDARIEVEGGMPDHNHGLPTSPQATAALGDGRYRIEGVKFSMSGWWQLRFAVSAAAGSDEATFNLVL